MGAKKGVVLKFLQWFIRGVQFGCAALTLAIFSYFLATATSRRLAIPTWVRAVEGISGAATLYTLAGLVLLCCVAGIPAMSFIAVVLDVAFAGAFIYVASANRGGAGSCNGIVDTPFGTGDADTDVIIADGNDGVRQLPNLRGACRLESAVLAVSIVAIFFFLFSAVMEVLLVRHHKREKRFGPSPANNYTSGYGSAKGRRGGLFSSFRRKRAGTASDPNALPAHPHPAQVRDSYATETTAVGAEQPATAAAYGGGHHNKHGESGIGHTGNLTAPAEYPPANYRYEDGVYHSRGANAAV